MYKRNIKGQFVKGNPSPKWMLGRKHTPEVMRKIILANSGEKSYAWKGDKVSYSGLHKWVNKILGRPNKCSTCGKIGYGHSMHWANISKNYKRNIKDWVRLCVSCHKYYDKNKIKLQ